MSRTSLRQDNLSDDKPVALTRGGYARIADVIMTYCTQDLQMDMMAALPFVSSLTERLRPTIETMLNKATDLASEHKTSKRANPSGPSNTTKGTS